ncbi:MAG: hypothetical protein GYB65_03410 [Chloroflexi bacterium]|nr:hypothetical protein [Chloroflexota bacterium]
MATVRRKGLRVVVIGVVLVVGLIGLVWVGFQVKPRPFDAFAERTAALDTIPIPDDLPAPVARFYAVITDGTGVVPVVDSAVLTGRADLRINGISFQARFRFTHEAGVNYRHYIEGTCFGQPLLKVNERYVDGISRMELPWASSADEPQINQAANLGLWAESMWLPSVFLTDPRVRWEPIDANTARLIVPFEEGEDEFTVYFDAETGLITEMVALRYKEADSAAKTEWIVRATGWAMYHGVLIPVISEAEWDDENGPWAVFYIEDAVYNADVSDYIRQKGL